jgi:hypothetical protein
MIHDSYKSLPQTVLEETYCSLMQEGTPAEEVNSWFRDAIGCEYVRQKMLKIGAPAEALDRLDDMITHIIDVL